MKVEAAHRSAAIGAALLAALPGAAQAATARVSGGEVRYNGGGEANAVTVSQTAPGTFRFADTGATIAPGSGCGAENRNSVSCSAPNATRLAIALAGGADRAAVVDQVLLPALILGGSGRDSLRGGGGPDIIRGEGDRDSLSGRAGADRLEGGNGNDGLNGGLGNDAELGMGGDDTFHHGAGANGGDLLDGGGGSDLAVYAARTAPLAISLDGRANDGDRLAGERDDVRPSVERVSGGTNADSISGNGGANRLAGGAGGDVLSGGGGRDAIAGGAGDDTVRGGSGRDALSGGPGLDELTSRDTSLDTVECGDGRDILAADRLDAVRGDCEVVRRSLSMRLRRTTTRLSRSGVLPVEVVCPPAAFGACSGSVVVRTARRVRTRSGARVLRLASRRLAVGPGDTTVVNLRVRRRPRAYLRRVRRVAVRAMLVNGADSAGPSRRAALRFRLRAPR